MKKHYWKIEYSITICVIFALILLFLPSRFIASKEASYISEWNSIYHKMEYVFNAMNAHVDSDIVLGLKNAQSNEKREQYMMNLVKSYLRLNPENKLKKRYKPSYMNSTKVNSKDEFYFDGLYLSQNNHIVGIKNVKDEDIYHPAFIMMFDVNGLKGPNKWGRDIFGINIFLDGHITPLGAGKDKDELSKNCSLEGMGVYCSYYYRIGGDFYE